MESVALESAFWALSGLVAYVYVGYPLAIAALATVRRRPPATGESSGPPPKVTLLFCVHNGLPLLRDKIDNCLAIDYPRDSLEILAISDGSTDGSAEMLMDYERQGLIRTHIEVMRCGKTAALDRGVEKATGDILLFTDASTRLEAPTVRRHVRHYGDPAVGAVGGEMRFLNAARASMSHGHGLYWRYERRIRASESALGILACVPGANYSMRRSLWRPVPPQYADDCVSPLNVVLQGRRVLYDPEAVAGEITTETMEGVFARRSRMVTRDFDATLRHARLLNPLRAGGVAISLLSHKLLRWLVPVALVALLIVNLPLAGRPIYAVALALQAAFYAVAAIGARRGDGAPRSRLLAFPLYFCVSNLGALHGLLNVALRRRIGVWNPVGAR